MARPELLAGVDVGTSAVKVLAVTPSGETRASDARQYPLETPAPGRFEQDAELVVAATMNAIGRVLATVAARGEHVAAIGFSCAMHGVLPVDAAGVPLGPLVTWLDERAAPVADEWRRDGTAREAYRRTGAPVHAMLPACKLRWFAEFEPRTASRAAKFVSLKELIVFRLTGEWLVDYGVASGTGLFDVRTLDWNDAALAAAHIDAGRLSALATPTTSRSVDLSTLTDGAVRGATTLVLGSSDGALASLGVGADEAHLALSLGSSGALRSTTSRPLFDERARTFCYYAYDGRYVVGGATNAGGAALTAFAALFVDEPTPEARFARALALAETSTPGARALTVTPFLAGERAPYWAAGLRGGIAGLDATHARADVMRAAFEGVAFGLAAIAEVLRERIEIQEIRLSGGVCRSAFVRQLLADVFGVAASLSAPEEASAYGAAMLAGLAIGAVEDERAVATTLRPLHVHAPDAGRRRAYGAAFERYRAAVAAQLATLRSDY